MNKLSGKILRNSGSFSKEKEIPKKSRKIWLIIKRRLVLHSQFKKGKKRSLLKFFESLEIAAINKVRLTQTIIKI